MNFYLHAPHSESGWMSMIRLLVFVIYLFGGYHGFKTPNDLVINFLGSDKSFLRRRCKV